MKKAGKVGAFPGGVKVGGVAAGKQPYDGTEKCPPVLGKKDPKKKVKK